VFVSGTVGYDLRTNTWPPTAQAQAEMSLDIIERRCATPVPPC
jgi:hypothetical protein